MAMSKGLLVLTGCLLVACDGDRGSSIGYLRSDSAGVEIVENLEPAWSTGTEGWEVEARPALSIGAEEGEEPLLLSRIAGAYRISHGRIAVGNAGTGEIRVFSASGEHLASMGGSGRGPEEFEALRLVGVALPDSLFAYDFVLRRFTVFSPDGELIRSVTLPPLGFGSISYAGRLQDGRHLLRGVRSGQGPSTGLYRDSVTYLALSNDGPDLIPLGTLPGKENFVVVSPSGWSGYERPFSASPQLTTGGGRVYFTEGESYEISELRPDGTVSGRWRRSFTRAAVTPGDIARYRSDLVSGVTGPNRSRLEEVASRMPYPESTPAISNLLVDPDGHVWAADYLAAGDTVPRWSVFTPGGRWLGTVQTPPGLTVTQVGSDFVLGTFRDGMDVEYVRLHRIRKPNA